MEFTVINWNLNAFALSGQAERLADLDWDIATLQEVTRESWPRLLEVIEPAGGYVAINHLPPIAGKLPRNHAAVLVRQPWAFSSEGSLRDVPSPERTLVGTVTRDDVSFQVGSLGAPPGQRNSWGRAGKSRQMERIAAWLRDRDAPTIVGIDANTPKFESRDLADTQWWHEREAVLLGVNRAHDLRDAYRDWLEQDPTRMEQVLEERPEGPLAISHLRGHTTPCRYDFVLASPEFEVREVSYLMDEAVEAGSDHALVRARLRLDDHGS